MSHITLDAPSEKPLIVLYPSFQQEAEQIRVLGAVGYAPAEIGAVLWKGPTQ